MSCTDLYSDLPGFRFCFINWWTYLFWLRVIFFHSTLKTCVDTFAIQLTITSNNTFPNHFSRFATWKAFGIHPWIYWTFLYSYDLILASAIFFNQVDPCASLFRCIEIILSHGMNPLELNMQASLEATLSVWSKGDCLSYVIFGAGMWSQWALSTILFHDYCQ